MYSNILSFVKTKDDHDRLENAISELSAAVFKKSDGVEEVLRKIGPPELSRGVKALLGSKEAPDTKDELLKGLKKELKALTALKITFSKTPSLELLDEVADWVKQNIQNAYTEYDVDPSIIGGVQISFKGEFRDFSLRQKLEDYLSKNKENILGRVKANG